MWRRGMTITGLLFSLALLIAALWGWHSATALPGRWGLGSGASGVWAVRCGAIAAGALAQVLALSALAHGPYRRDVVSDILRLSGLLVFMVAGVIAVALGLAGG